MEEKKRCYLYGPSHPSISTPSFSHPHSPTANTLSSSFLCSLTLCASALSGSGASGSFLSALPSVLVGKTWWLGLFSGAHPVLWSSNSAPRLGTASRALLSAWRQQLIPTSHSELSHRGLLPPGFTDSLRRRFCGPQKASLTARDRWDRQSSDKSRGKWHYSTAQLTTCILVPHFPL